MSTSDCVAIAIVVNADVVIVVAIERCAKFRESHINLTHGKRIAICVFFLRVCECVVARKCR